MTNDEVLQQMDAARAQHIARMADMEGWQILAGEIKARIEALTARIISGNDSGTIESTETSRVGGKTYITIVQVNRDEYKHELKVWKNFLQRVEGAKGVRE